MTQSKSTRTSTYHKRWRDGNHEQRSDLIVEVALDLLERESIEGVTVRKVAGLLGVGAMTLYTYVQGQVELRLLMIQRGFVLLRQHCDDDTPNNTREHWQRGARSYVQFAVDHPRLYELMFSQPIVGGKREADAVAREFEPFFAEIRELLEKRGHQADALDTNARAIAGRLWINMHGLASLAISGRLNVLHLSVDAILDDVVNHLGLDEMV